MVTEWIASLTVCRVSLQLKHRVSEGVFQERASLDCLERFQATSACGIAGIHARDTFLALFGRCFLIIAETYEARLRTYFDQHSCEETRPTFLNSFLRARKFLRGLIEPRSPLAPRRENPRAFRASKGLVSMHAVRREPKKRSASWMTIIRQWLGLAAGDGGHKYPGAPFFARTTRPLFHPPRRGYSSRIKREEDLMKVAGSSSCETCESRAISAMPPFFFEFPSYFCAGARKVMNAACLKTLSVD